MELNNILDFQLYDLCILSAYIPKTSKRLQTHKISSIIMKFNLIKPWYFYFSFYFKFSQYHFTASFNPDLKVKAGS